MKKSLFVVALAVGGIFNATAQEILDLKEAVVTGTPKERIQLQEQSVSYSSFDAQELENQKIETAKDLSARVPNFYMPAYGSSQTSSIYIRGIGSRTGDAAVGMYVDNLPLLDKSSYSLQMLDVAKIDVLRGPQGTLYGRNAMGGIVRVTTNDPLKSEKTWQHRIKLGGTTRSGGREAGYSLHWHPTATFGASLNAFYEGQQGFFRNQFTGHHADHKEAGGARLKLSWRPSNVVRLDYIASYEQSDENACPYANSSDEIAQNRQSTYRRKLFTQGITATHFFNNMQFTSLTSHQILHDRLFLDQDFTAKDVFSLCQTQKQQGVSEELTLRSRNDDRWQWTNGLFVSYLGSKIDCPVPFYSDGIDYLNGIFKGVLPANPPMTLAFTGTSLPFQAHMETPDVNAAIFHQSTVKLAKGLKATVGLRLDYDYHHLKLNSQLAEPAQYNFAMPAMKINHDFETSLVIDGTQKKHNWQLLPRFALNYELPKSDTRLYLSVAKGYRSGGYNIQSYSNLAQTQLQREMMLSVRDYSVNTINALPMPEETKQKAIAGMLGALEKNIPAESDVNSLYYKPQTSWNFELGMHGQWKGFRVQCAAFAMLTNDLQLARFSNEGYGRETVNAGKSRSLGVEVSADYDVKLQKSAISSHISYGFTDSRFCGDKAEGMQTTRVPFVPEHTLAAGVVWRHDCGFSLGANLQSAGAIRWYENEFDQQNFYALLDLRAGYEIGPCNLAVYAKNVTATRYDSFRFKSLGNEFHQVGTPRHFGIEFGVKF